MSKLCDDALILQISLGLYNRQRDDITNTNWSLDHVQCTLNDVYLHCDEQNADIYKAQLTAMKKSLHGYDQRQMRANREK